MRGYVSFLLALLGSLILLDLLSVHSASSGFDFSRAAGAERAYGLEMNVKETVLESARAGAAEGFGRYDAAHDVKMCAHCPDNACAVPTPVNPYPPNRCDGFLCGLCFRESGARESAAAGALERLSLLRSHAFDSDFDVSFGSAELESSLGPDALSKNGFSLDWVRFRKAYRMNITSAKLGAGSASSIPGGFTLDIG